VASLWRARIGVKVKAFRIRWRAVFCCDCSVLARPFCPVYQISEPKSDLDITHAWWRVWVADGDRPVLWRTRLPRALRDLAAAVSLTFT
jgi:hypothetical protein